MATNTVWPAIDGQHLVQSVEEVISRLDKANPEVVLDFSSVHRIVPSELNALERLAAAAGDKSVRLVLRGVDVDVYRVLKLVKLAPRFLFET